MEAKVISLRVSSSVAQALERAARARRTSKSRIILESLKVALDQPRVERSSFEIGKDLFGRHGSGRRNTARRHRKLYREYVSEKHARRQRSARRAI
ncbi:MAG TPA: hypothetical protein VEH02_09290 [Pseudolabrys sp.]|nr:hypothetical protein [Pseudolabrys sp.]